MILRSVTKHVREQNWFAVGLDFFIVVIGVFIGLQVANWNEQRIDDRLESEILNDILADLERDEEELTNALRMTEVNIENGAYALRAADVRLASFIELPIYAGRLPISSAGQDQANDHVEPDWLWRNLVFRYHPSRSSTALDTLVANGRLGLISDRELVRQLQSHQSTWKSLEEAQNATLRPFRDQAIFVGQKFGISPFGEMSEAEFIAILREQTELQGAARTLLEYAALHRAFLFEARASTQALLERLAEARPQ